MNAEKKFKKETRKAFDRMVKLRMMTKAQADEAYKDAVDMGLKKLKEKGLK